MDRDPRAFLWDVEQAGGRMNAERLLAHYKRIAASSPRSMR